MTKTLPQSYQADRARARIVNAVREMFADVAPDDRLDLSDALRQLARESLIVTEEERREFRSKYGR